MLRDIDYNPNKWHLKSQAPKEIKVHNGMKKHKKLFVSKYFLFFPFYATLLIYFPSFFSIRWRDSIDSNKCVHDQKKRFYHANKSTTWLGLPDLEG